MICSNATYITNSAVISNFNGLLAVVTSEAKHVALFMMQCVQYAQTTVLRVLQR